MDDGIVSPGCRSAIEDRDAYVAVFEGSEQAHVVVVVVAMFHGEGFDVRVAGQGTFEGLGRGAPGTLFIVAVGTVPKAVCAIVFAVLLQATPAESSGTASPAETVAGAVLFAQSLHGAQVDIGGAGDVSAVGPLGSVLEGESALDVSRHLAVCSAAAAVAMNTVRFEKSVASAVSVPVATMAPTPTPKSSATVAVVAPSGCPVALVRPFAATMFVWNPLAGVDDSATADFALGGVSGNSLVENFDRRSVVVFGTSGHEGSHVVVARGEDGSPAAKPTMLVEVGDAAWRDSDGRGLVVVHFASKAMEITVSDSESCP